MDCATNNELLIPYYPFIINRCATFLSKHNTIHLDLANQIYLSIVTINNDTLVTLITTNKIEAYINTAIYNELRSSTSTFARLYKREPNYLTPPDNDTTVDLSFENINRLTDFDKKMLALYTAFGSYEVAAKQARMDKGTLIKYIKQIKKKLQWLNLNLN